MSPVVRRIVQLLVLTLVQAAVLFAFAGTVAWAAGWLYVGLYVGMLVLASVVFLPRHAEVVAERSRGTAGGKAWDVRLTRVQAVPTLAILAVAGFDERFAWTAPLPWPIRALGVVLFVGGYAVVLWAMSVNTYFSEVVRIQTERGHRVITDGPYRIVRHPGYVGMLGSALGSTALLDSPWSLVPWALYAGLVVLRTVLEDRTLRAELPGYQEYAARTRYRLLPGLW